MVPSPALRPSSLGTRLARITHYASATRARHHTTVHIPHPRPGVRTSRVRIYRETNTYILGTTAAPEGNQEEYYGVSD